MSKRIFVSRSEFDMGRDRSHRQLEASLDKNNKGLDFQGNQESDVQYPIGDSCPHFGYCNVRKFSKINCLTPNTIRTCSTYKSYEEKRMFVIKTGLQRFMERYPDYEFLGIGSKI